VADRGRRFDDLFNFVCDPATLIMAFDRVAGNRGARTPVVDGFGIPTVADRVVQAVLKLVLEPIFEADFLPVSYGFRRRRRAHDAIAEIHHFGTRGYRWVFDADIEACFDSISHAALMDRVRARVKDKRVVALVKAFLKAGVLTELGDQHLDRHAARRHFDSSTAVGNLAMIRPPGRCRWCLLVCSGRGWSAGW
jgi:RNA-directed DNA polymerase